MFRRVAHRPPGTNAAAADSILMAARQHQEDGAATVIVMRSETLGVLPSWRLRRAAAPAHPRETDVYVWTRDLASRV